MTLPSNGMQYLHNTRSGFPTVKSLFIVAAPYVRYASPPSYSVPESWQASLSIYKATSAEQLYADALSLGSARSGY